ncbi:MAG: hypothetical protein EBY32_12300, partial [Proteobacteria bacterium]|nr:hypothetical protein [Pseudomonadota bacterium]
STDRNFTLTANTTSVIDVFSAGTTLTFLGNSTSTTGAFTKNGSGTLILSGSNTYTGATTINAGTLLLGATERIANSSNLVVNSGGTFNLANYTETVGDLSGSGNLNLGNGNLTVGASGSTTFNGTISVTSSGSLRKSGSGSLILYSDLGGSVPFVQGGNLTLMSNNNTFAGSLSIYGNATLNVSSMATGASTMMGNSTGGSTTTMGTTTSGTLNYTGSGESTSRNIKIGNTGNATGNATVNANGVSGGAGLIFSNGVFNSPVGNSTTNRSLTLGGSNTDNNTISGVIADNTASTGLVSLIKADAGKWILNGNNTYTGTTTINAGTLILNGNNTGTGAVNVAAGATLGGNGTIGGAVTVAGSLNPGTASTLTLGSTLTFGSGSTLALTLGSNSSKIAFLSTGNLLGSANATLSLTQDTGFDYGATYRIFENTSTTGFAFASITGYDTSAYQAQFAYALLLFGLAGVIFARRRLRSRRAVASSITHPRGAAFSRASLHS